MNQSREVLLFSTADWDNAFWTNKQHQACELARRGFRVLYVESVGLRRPGVHGRDLRRIMHRLLKGLRGVHPVAPNIWVLSPLVVPFHRKPGIGRLNDLLLTGAIRRASAALHFTEPILWTYQPLVERLLDRLPHRAVVYHCVDDLGAAPGIAADVIHHAEARLLRSADVVFATSLALATACSRASSGPVHYLPNVADYEHFAKAAGPGPIPADLARIPKPRVGFIGAISDYKLDFEVVAAIARQRPGWHWVLIGQVGEGQPWVSAERLQAPNIHLLGPRSYAVLPDYLRGLDLATIPAPRNPYTLSMFPMKFFEYLAAGKPVVALNVPALVEFQDACCLTNSPADFLAAIDRVLAGDIPDPQRCRALAQHYTWNWRTDAMLDILESTRNGQAARGDSECPSPPYSGERGWGEGVKCFQRLAPSPPTPLPLSTEGEGHEWKKCEENETMSQSTTTDSPSPAQESSPWSDRRIVVILLFIAAVLHGIMVAATAMPARDTIGFVQYALRLEAEPWPTVIRKFEQHPGYPVAILAASFPVRHFLGTTPESMRLSAQLPSALAGILLVIPLYYLTRQWLDRRSAFAAALLFQVLPVCLHITSDGLSEGLFLLLAASGICLAAQGYRLRSPVRLASCGLFGSLAYLTRPEGAVIVVAALAVLLSIQAIPAQRWPWRTWVASVCSLAVTTAIFASPYPLITGRFTRKPTGREMMNPLGGEADVAPADQTGALPSGDTPLLACLLAARWDTIDPTGSPTIPWCLRAIADETARTFQWFLFFPFLIGVWRDRHWLLTPQSWLLAMIGFLHVAILVRLVIAVGYVSERHTLLIALVCMPTTGGALVALGDALRSRLGDRWRPARWDGGLVGVLLVAFLLLAPAFQRLHAGAIGHRAAGEWLAEHAQLRDKIVDPFSWANYYSGRTLQGPNPPVGSAGENRTCYVIVETYARPHPSVPQLERARQLAATGTCVFRYAAGNSHRPTVEVFAIPLTNRGHLRQGKPAREG